MGASEHLKEVEETEAAAAVEKKRKKTERDMRRAQKKRQDQQEAERKHAARQAKLHADQDRASSAHPKPSRTTGDQERIFEDNTRRLNLPTIALRYCR